MATGWTRWGPGLAFPPITAWAVSLLIEQLHNVMWTWLLEAIDMKLFYHHSYEGDRGPRSSSRREWIKLSKRCASDGFTTITGITCRTVLLYVIAHAGPIVIARQHFKSLEVTVMSA